MLDDGFSERLVTQSEIAELAALFDRFEFALDPRSMSAKEAESEFDTRVHQLFQERVAPNYTSISILAFRCRIKSVCRAYLKKNIL